MITVMIADDHRIVREGLRAILEGDAELSILAESTDGLDTIEKIIRYKPDVLIQDWVMPHLSGADLTREVKRLSPKTQILILSMHVNESYVIEALTSGAMGYLLKNNSGVELRTAIREVKNGHRYLGSPLSEMAIDAYIFRSSPVGLDVYESLTTRERETLGLICEGNTGAAIAEKLSLSPRTVEKHRANMMHKLGLHSEIDVIRFALKRGLVKPDQLV